MRPFKSSPLPVAPSFPQSGASFLQDAPATRLHPNSGQSRSSSDRSALLEIQDRNRDAISQAAVPSLSIPLCRPPCPFAAVSNTNDLNQAIINSGFPYNYCATILPQFIMRIAFDLVDSFFYFGGRPRRFRFAKI